MEFRVRFVGRSLLDYVLEEATQFAKFPKAEGQVLVRREPCFTIETQYVLRPFGLPFTKRRYWINPLFKL
jgi:hypothetical protein